MNSLSVAVFFVALAAASAGLIAGGIATPIDTAAVVSGPSGQIVRSGIAAPLAVAHAAPLAVAHAAPLAVAHAAPLAVAHAAPIGIAAPAISHRAAQAALSLSVPAGSGLEGQWIPDINEKLYDDGSYKPYVYGF